MPGQRLDHAGFAQHHRQLEVEPEAALVEIGAADHAQVLVHQQRLGVQHARAVFEDAHAGGDQLVVVGARRQRDHARIAHPRHHHAHVQPAEGGGGQRHLRRFAGHEVGRDQPHPLPGFVDGRHLHAVDGFPRGVRAGHQRLRLDVAVAAPRHAGRPGVHHVERARLLPGGVDPVLDEHQLQAAHDVAFQAHVQVAVGVGAQRVVFRVGDVDAAGVADTAVDDGDLAVAAQVEPGPGEQAQARRMEPGELAAGLDQRREERGAQRRGTHRVDQHLHHHPGARPFHQRIAQLPAGAVVGEDVVLQMDLPARPGDVAEQGRVGGRAVHQPAHLAGGGGGQAGHRLAQPRQFGAFHVRRADVAEGLHARAGMAAAQALAPDLLRAEQEIDEEAEIGQRGQRQHPAQRRGRFALLQHDPDAQAGQIGQPRADQPAPEVGKRVEPVAGGMQGIGHARILDGAGRIQRGERPRIR